MQDTNTHLKLTALQANHIHTRDLLQGGTHGQESSAGTVKKPSQDHTNLLTSEVQRPRLTPQKFSFIHTDSGLCSMGNGDDPPLDSGRALYL